jgi:hypothetical protein
VQVRQAEMTRRGWRTRRLVALMAAVSVAMMATLVMATAARADGSVWLETWVSEGPHLGGESHELFIDVGWDEHQHAGAVAHVGVEPASVCEGNDAGLDFAGGSVTASSWLSVTCTFEVDDLGPGVDEVTVEVDLRDSEGASIDSDSMTAPLDVVHLETTTFDLQGTVTDPAGAAIVDLCVEAYVSFRFDDIGQFGYQPEGAAETTSTSDGYEVSVDLELPTAIAPDRRFASVEAFECDGAEHWGFANSFTEDFGETLMLDLEVEPRVQVSGTVVDAATNQAPGSCVQVYEYRDGERTATSARAEPNGTFDLRTAPGDAQFRFDVCFMDLDDLVFDDGEPYPYATQFYDGAPDLASAATVELVQFSATDLGQIVLSEPVSDPDPDDEEPGDGAGDDELENGDEREDGPPTSPSPTLVLPGGTTVSEGGVVGLVACCFAPASEVEVWLFSDPVLLATLVADDDGSIDDEVTIPAGTPPGEHTLELRGTGADGEPLVLSVGVTVEEAEAVEEAIEAPDGDDEGPADRLPETGASVTGYLVGGLLALIVGAMALLSTGGRRSAVRVGGIHGVT